MITSEFFNKDNYSIQVSPPWEDYMVTYKETNEIIQRECFFVVGFSKKKRFLKTFKFVTIYLDSIRVWRRPKEDLITVEEIKLILKRLSDYLYDEGFYVKLDFGMITKEQAMKMKK